jgi:hypothetical protein
MTQPAEASGSAFDATVKTEAIEPPGGGSMGDSGGHDVDADDEAVIVEG